MVVQFVQVRPDDSFMVRALAEGEGLGAGGGVESLVAPERVWNWMLVEEGRVSVQLKLPKEVALGVLISLET